MSKSGIDSDQVRQTRWSIVTVLVLTGTISALQVSKVAIALPLFQQEFSISLFIAASAIGAYAVLGAVFGMPLGFIVSFNARQSVLLGLIVAALGSFVGAAASDGVMLVAARALEGCGFLATVLAIPSLLRRASSSHDRDVVLSLWATYLPSGAAIMMLIGPALLQLGWQSLWVINGALSLIAAAIVFFVRVPGTDAPSGDRHFEYAGAVLRSKGTLLLALTFLLYTFQFMAMAGLLPTLLVHRAGLSVTAAGLITALTWVANAVGNASAGLLLRAGIPIWQIVLGAFSLMGVAAFGVFSDSLPLPAVVGLACISLGLTGLIPGSIFPAAARVSPVPAMLILSLGLINQGSNIGTLLGPSALGLLVQNFGWDNAWIMFAAVALCGIAVALGLRTLFADRK